MIKKILYGLSAIMFLPAAVMLVDGYFLFFFEKALTSLNYSGDYTILFAFWFFMLGTLPFMLANELKDK